MQILNMLLTSYIHRILGHQKTHLWKKHYLHWMAISNSHMLFPIMKLKGEKINKHCIFLWFHVSKLPFTTMCKLEPAMLSWKIAHYKLCFTNNNEMRRIRSIPNSGNMTFETGHIPYHYVCVPSQWETVLQCNIISLAQHIHRMIPAYCMRK